MELILKKNRYKRRLQSPCIIPFAIIQIDIHILVNCCSCFSDFCGIKDSKMKAVALFSILAVFTEAAVIERQEHGHSDGAMAPTAKVRKQHSKISSIISIEYNHRLCLFHHRLNQALGQPTRSNK